MLKAAINGGRKRAEHLAIPITPEEIAREAQRAIAAGADAIHLHIRGRDGLESYAADDVDRVIRAVRAECPGAAIGVGTGIWVTNDGARRLELVRSWRVLPDFASVNYHEDGSPELAEHLLDRGVGIEGALWSPESARLLVARGIADRCLRILIEPLDQDFAKALDGCDQIERVLDAAAVRAARLLHGYAATSWPMLAEASRRGYAMRTGLEDTLVLPDGSPAAGNAELVAAALAVAAKAKH